MHLVSDYNVSSESKYVGGMFQFQVDKFYFDSVEQKSFEKKLVNETISMNISFFDGLKW